MPGPLGPARPAYLEIDTSRERGLGSIAFHVTGDRVEGTGHDATSVEAEEHGFIQLAETVQEANVHVKARLHACWP